MITAKQEVGELLAQQPLGDEDATDALIAELTQRGLLDLDLHSRLERARRVAVEMTRRVDLAEQFMNAHGAAMARARRDELLEILQGDR